VAVETRSTHDEPTTRSASTGIQLWLESTPVGKLVLLLVAGLLTGLTLIQNLPPSHVPHQLAKTNTTARALGYDGTWSMFAPDPYVIDVHVEARIRYRDGTSRTWSPPRGDPVLGELRDFRWRKFEEWLRKDSYRWVWQPTAAYIARHEQQQGREPVEVTLIRRWQDLLPPGPGPARGPEHQFAFYTWQVPAGGRS
jgi:hypothetical protein